MLDLALVVIECRLKEEGKGEVIRGEDIAGMGFSGMEAEGAVEEEIREGLFI